MSTVPSREKMNPQKASVQSVEKFRRSIEQKLKNARRYLEKHRLAWKKPTRGKLEAPLPKPVVAEGTAGDKLDVDEDERENASDEDEEE
ncbi:uncharacterized protein BJ212DRAFT_1337277 [Suillus subaureus]|uniref:Uncharacterized protein n=1 Tax=Suillus subaureus TaxID=48587 RepID=A0A9P7EHI5_9AGAM|nr:uncharacterized protein BJ212DRAFT_1337277 [Suillus subaureus]KAG1821080.1 hypothetical protein BJ212DRAFT_1337277 [Suillus subaureus]